MFDHIFRGIDIAIIVIRGDGKGGIVRYSLDSESVGKKREIQCLTQAPWVNGPGDENERDKRKLLVRWSLRSARWPDKKAQQWRP